MRLKTKTIYDYEAIKKLYDSGLTFKQVKEKLNIDVSAHSICQALRNYENSLVAAKLDNDHPFARRVMHLAQLGKTDLAITEVVIKEYSCGSLGVINFKQHYMAIKVLADRARPENFKVYDEKLYRSWSITSLYVDNIRNMTDLGFTISEIADELISNKVTVYRCAESFGIKLNPDNKNSRNSIFDIQPYKLKESMFYKSRDAFNILKSTFKDRGFSVYAP